MAEMSAQKVMVGIGTLTNNSHECYESILWSLPNAHRAAIS
jgi:hypothetical protein